MNIFFPQTVDVQGIKIGVNYGCDKVRFPAPVPDGYKLSGADEINAIEEVKRGVQTTIFVKVEIEGNEKLLA